MTTLPPTMLKPAEAAKHLKISRAHVYRLAKRGLIPAVYLGTTLRIPYQQLIDQIAEQAGPRRAA